MIKSIRNREQGVALVGVIFIVVAFALIGTFMMRLGTVQSVNIGNSIEAARAYNAAVSGLAWAVNQTTSSAANHDAICSTQPATTTTFTLNEASLSGFDITITCDDFKAGGFIEGCSNYELDRITVKAQRRGDTDTQINDVENLNYVSRTIRATVEGFIKPTAC
ncbi:MAG: hypothetical protein ACE5EH_12500 [Gammaproteobacteria bacterium]